MVKVSQFFDLFYYLFCIKQIFGIILENDLSHRNMLTYRPRENYEIHNLVLLLFKSEQNTKLVLRVH